MHRAADAHGIAQHATNGYCQVRGVERLLQAHRQLALDHL